MNGFNGVHTAGKCSPKINRSFIARGVTSQDGFEINRFTNGIIHADGNFLFCFRQAIPLQLYTGVSIWIRPDGKGRLNRQSSRIIDGNNLHSDIKITWDLWEKL